MRLCFGTFAAVLNCCCQDIQQAAFVARIAKCIDPQSSYIAIESRFVQEDDWEIAGDGPAISKLLHCTRSFVLGNSGVTSRPAIKDVVKKFEAHVAPFIIEDKKPAVIFTLLDIIQRDKKLDFEMKDCFGEYFGTDKQQLLQKREFIFSDFLGRVLLYTVYGGTDNTVGKEYVHLITKSYINKIADLYTCEYGWNQSAQTLTLTFVEIYLRLNQAIQRYQIDKFVEETDPTDIMEIAWIERCEGFLEDIKSNIWTPYAPAGSDAPGVTIRKVQEFAQILDAYTTYLGLNMRPIAERPDLFVPLYRDENAKWAVAFGAKVLDYRKQLISIYQEIYTRMPFAPKFVCSE